MIFFIGGINGVGKTSLIEALIKSRPSWRTVSVSAELMKRLDLPNHDALCQLPREQNIKEIGAIIQNALQVNRVVLFDIHFLNLIEGKVYTMTGPWLKYFTGLVLLYAPPEQIIGRLASDTKRGDRKLFKPNNKDDVLRSITDYQEATRQEFSKLAEEYHLPATIITHSNGSTARASQDLITFIETSSD